MFVLASAIAGVAGGAISVFFWKAAKFFIGAWGGLAFGLFIECFRNGGAIDPVGLRWIMYIGRACSDPFGTLLTGWPLSRVCCSWIRLVHNPKAALACCTCIHCLRRFDSVYARCGLFHYGGTQGGDYHLDRLVNIQFIFFLIVLHLESGLPCIVPEIRQQRHQVSSLSDHAN